MNTQIVRIEEISKDNIFPDTLKLLTYGIHRSESEYE